MTNELIFWKRTVVLCIFLHKNQLFFRSLTRNRDKLGLVLNPRDGLEERDPMIYLVFFLSNNVILLDITNTSYNYIKLVNTTLSLMIPLGGVKFSWPVYVVHENLTK